MEQYVRRKKFIVNVLYFGLAAALIYIAVKYVLALVVPFIIGFLFSLMLRPAIRFISKKTHLPYGAAAVILSLLLYAAICLLLIFLGAKIVLVLQTGFTSLPEIYAQRIAPMLGSLFGRLQNLSVKFDPNISQVVQNITSSVTSSVGSVVSGFSTSVIVFLSSTVFSLPGILLAALLSVISTVFFAMDSGKIAGYIDKLMPSSMRQNAATLRRVTGCIGKKYVKSYSIILAVTFVELSVGLLIMGVGNAIIIAALIAVVELVPLVGMGVVMIPWIIVKLAQGQTGFAIGLAVTYGVIIIVRNVMEPRIVGHEIGVHPLAMLISMYVGLQLFGFIGIFALPILLVVSKSFYEERKAGTLKTDEAVPTAAGADPPT